MYFFPIDLLFFFFGKSWLGLYMFDIVQGENETEGIIEIKNRIMDHLGLEKKKKEGKKG